MSYEFANARLRAMKSRLFDRSTFAALLSCASVDDLSARLAQTAYREDMQAALARYSGVRVVMEACSLHLARILRQVRSFFVADGARLLDILLARWDLFNLKAILRGHEAGRSPEQILEALVPAGQLRESALRALLRTREPLVLAETLKLWNVDYARALRAAWSVLGARSGWLAFESALDRVFYERLLGALDMRRDDDQLLRTYLAREIDAANILIALRLRADGPQASLPDSEAHFLPGGVVPLPRLAELARATRDDDALALLRATTFGSTLADAGSLSSWHAQRALDQDVARFGMTFFARDPLTIATAIGFVAAKRAEVSNVRLIAQGIALHATRGEMERDLLYADDS